MRAITLPVGVATGIGSLPHADAAAAVRFTFDHHPDLPSAPTRPAVEPLESMLAQAATGLTGVHVRPDGTLVVDGRLDPIEPYGAAGPGLDGPAFATYRAFFTAASCRREPIKAQLVGPLTLALALVRAGAPSREALATAGEAIRQRARALVELATELAPLAPLVVFVDEPEFRLVNREGFPVPAVEAVDLTSSALAAVETVAVTGLHCCAAADWRLALAIGPQILSLPLGAGIDRHAGALAGHLDAGGWVAWGVVPTQGPVSPKPGHHWRLLSDTWCDLVALGCDGIALREQAIITPACGLAGHDEPVADQIFGLTAELASRVRRQALGRHLAVGA